MAGEIGWCSRQKVVTADMAKYARNKAKNGAEIGKVYGLSLLQQPSRGLGFGFEAAEMHGGGGIGLLHNLAHDEAGEHIVRHDDGPVEPFGMLGGGVAPMVHYPRGFLGVVGVEQALVGQEAVPTVEFQQPTHLGEQALQLGKLARAGMELDKGVTVGVPVEAADRVFKIEPGSSRGH